MNKSCLVFLILLSNFNKNIYSTIDFQPFKAYMPKSDGLLLLTDIKYSDNKISNNIINELNKIKSYEDIKEIKDAISIKEFITNGFFEQDKKSSFYLYCQQRTDATNIGIIGKIAIDNYIKKEIKQHENIIESKAEFAQKIIDIQKAFIEPVLLSYKDNPKINSIIIKTLAQYPDFAIKTINKTRHLIWKINKKNDINAITKIFSGMPNLYIADGHHRCAAASRIKNDDIKYMTAALFSDEQITIYPYHRLLKNINNLSKNNFKETLRKHFDLVKSTKKTVPHKNIRLYFNTKWYTLKPKNHNSKITNIWISIKNTFHKKEYNILETIPSQLFQEKIINEIFGKDQEKINTSLEYISGNLSIDKIISKVEKENYTALFLLPALKPTELMTVVDYNKNLPPKSTWIEPKIKAGLVVKDLEE
ncbi:MAG: hypothetical protein SZ59_C0001G0134 [candidate division TM6 bacterium GW2011_GWF2_28_16]|nr:MAG: hypothetical protein SZ59_C0001G0134 [candidate division TM6 bacterium GW2011_GWF2_28_16]